MKVKSNNEEVLITLSKEEALVLFEWLANFNSEGKYDFSDQSEERILWDLEASLEKITNELFSDNYSDYLARARKNIRDVKAKDD